MENKKIKELTKAEEQIMQILWMIEKGFVKEIMEHLPEPKPAYNTVSTIVRILADKGFVAHKAYGNTHQYYPLISKDEYTKVYFKSFLTNYFGSSFRQMVSFFAKEDKMSIKEMEDVMNLMKEEINKQKK